MKICSMCNQDVEDVNKTFEAVKEQVSEDRHYIFREYAQKKRGICLECYIKTIVMFQMLPGKRGCATGKPADCT